MPVAVGANVPMIVQAAPGATVVPQLLVWLKSPLLAPVIAMPGLTKFNVVPPVFVSVTVFCVLWPTRTRPKFRLVVLKLAAAPLALFMNVQV